MGQRIMTDDEIISRAESLAHGSSTLGQLLGINAEELYGTASLALLLASHGSIEEATILMDGLVSLAPRDGRLFTLYAEVAHLDGDRTRALQLLEASFEMANVETIERVRRAELRLWGRDHTGASRELACVEAAPADPMVVGRMEKLQRRLARTVSGEFPG